MSVDPLIDELRVAFPPVPLTAKGAFYWYSDAELCERSVEGKVWEEVDARLIGTRSDALVFLDLDRFVAWLPIYLHHFVTTDPLHSVIWDTLNTKLLPPDPATSSKRQQRAFEEFANRLTAAQRRVVARSLQRVVESFPAWGERPQRALAFWGAFTETKTVKQNPLLDELRAAFPPAPIVAGEAFESYEWFYAYEYECAIDGKTWEGLDPLFITEHASALDYLGEAALRAVLPSYLHLLLVWSPRAPSNQHAFSVLTRPVPNRFLECQQQRFERFVNGLTVAQRGVIARCLQQFIGDAPEHAEPARIALERYWAEYA